jgi:hypothetical protein
MRRSLVALATVLVHGCATVHPPAPFAGAAPAPRVALAEPELELWMEGTAPGPIDAGDSSRSLEAARTALARSLDRRGFATAGAADQVLVVRAAAVVRAEERRGRQAAATIGAVLLLVAVVAILVAATRNGGGGGHGGRGVAGVAPPRGGAPVPRPSFHPPHYGRPLYPAPWPWWGFGIHVYVPVQPMAAVPGPGGVPFGAPTLPSRLAGRGFWSSDEVELVFELREVASGQVVWTRATRAELDVRDAGRLREVVDKALWDQPWARPPLAP